jgi:cell division FtsZ-interacting protein ZapD
MRGFTYWLLNMLHSIQKAGVIRGWLNQDGLYKNGLSASHLLTLKIWQLINWRQYPCISCHNIILQLRLLAAAHIKM